MLARAGSTAPLASSCGRLFDAVAAAVEICFDRQAYEGEAAARLEAVVDPRDEQAYSFASSPPDRAGPRMLDARPMWSALCDDLAAATPAGVISGRFHRGLARAIADMVAALAAPPHARRFDTVALTGGCFQNRVLLEQCATRLRSAGFAVLAHARVPTNDGGLALGQAAVCAAQLLAT